MAVKEKVLKGDVLWLIWHFDFQEENSAIFSSLF